MTGQRGMRLGSSEHLGNAGRRRPWDARHTHEAGGDRIRVDKRQWEEGGSWLCRRLVLPEEAVALCRVGRLTQPARLFAR